MVNEYIIRRFDWGETYVEVGENCMSNLVD